MKKKKEQSMKLSMNIFLAALLFFSIGVSAQKTVRVACVGNSITYGAFIPNREKNCYPAQLQAYLGSEYEVKNFGVSGSTVLTKGDYPYVKTPAYNDSRLYNPQIVFIKLGTNDSKPQNWKYDTEFKANYQALIDSYRQLKSKPRIILLTPLRCYLPLGSEINDSIIRTRIRPLVEELASENKLEIIDFYPLFGENADRILLPDLLHPSSIGSGIIAKKLYTYLVSGTKQAKKNPATHPIPGNEFRSAAGWVEGAEWHQVAEDITATLQGKKLNLLLLGNSITQGWGGNRKAVNYKPGRAAMDKAMGENLWESAGISGDRTENLLWRIRNGNYNCCRPQNAVIAIGINNLLSGNDTPEAVAEGIIAVAKEARKQLPDTHIILIGLLPAGKDTDSDIRKKCNDIHRILSKSSIRGVKYVNPTNWFLEADGNIKAGLYGSDYIHLTTAGYEVWANEIVKLLK